MGKRIFVYILVSCAIIGLVVDGRDFMRFLSEDPLAFTNPDIAGLEALMEADVPTNYDDYALAIECMRRGIPQNASILTFKRFWLTNYYLYPTRVYYMSESKFSEENARKFIIEHQIDYIAVSGKSGVKVVKAEIGEERPETE